MSTPLAVPFGKDTLSVLDHEGTGRDIILVHAPGYCATSWNLVAAHLPDAHVYAFDLPGHGRSTGVLRDAVHVREAIMRVVDELSLRRPVVVGNDASAYGAVTAAMTAPERIGGVVAMGGFCLRSAEVFAETVEFARSDEITRMLIERFRFGEIGEGEAFRAEIIDFMLARAEDDWLLQSIRAGLREEVDWSLPPLPDGRFIHHPRPESVQNSYLVPDGEPTPSPQIFDRFDHPTHLVMSIDGQDGDLLEVAKAVRDSDSRIALTATAGGYGPHYSYPEVIAEAVVEVVSRL